MCEPTGIIERISISRMDDRDMQSIADVKINMALGNRLTKRTIYDTSMGTCKNDVLCSTCTKNNMKCIGGYGYIELKYPYYLPNVSKTICNLFDKRCLSCLRISSIKKCIECNTSSNVVKLAEKKNTSNDSNWEYQFVDKFTDTVIPVEELKSYLDIILEKNTLINKILIVTPPCTRPYFTIKGQNGECQSGDVSLMYNSILKKTATQKETFNKIEMLLTQKKKRPLPNSPRIPQSILDKLQHRNGLITNGINGRRTDHSARAIITGFSNGMLGTVGIPLKMAEKSTFPIPLCSLGDICTDAGKQAVVDFFIKSGRKILRIIDRVTEMPYNFNLERATRILNLMSEREEKRKNTPTRNNIWIERPLQNGDIVLFNRQPSLRPESIIAHRVVIIPKGDTFRLTLPVTPALNADFDGDESNLHVIQDYISAIECIELMAPKEMIISSQNGIPLITPVQDAIMGLYLLTLNTCISEDVIYRLMESISVYVDYYEYKKNIWNTYNTTSHLCGWFCFSLLLDDALNCYGDCFIQHGIVVVHKNKTNALTKSILCSGYKAIIHLYYFMVGKEETCTFIDNCQYVSNKYLAISGYSVGLKECMRDSTFDEELNLPDIIDADTILTSFENSIKNTKIKDNLDYMICSEVKASYTNAIQIKKLVGLQSIDGSVIENEMRSGRSLPYSPDNTHLNKNSRVYLKSKGFIENSFCKGLTISDTHYHCKAGRKGVADSVVKVAESGYLNKKLSKLLENNVICYDYSIRDMDSKRIIAYTYGHDGFNIQKLPSDLVHGTYEKVYFTRNELIAMDCFNIHKFKLMLDQSQLGLNLVNPIITNVKHHITKSIQACYPDIDQCVDYTPITAKSIRAMEIFLHTRTLQPGTAIGLISSTNFGEIISQLLLKSFHHSGIKSRNLNSGISRMNQLLNRTIISKNVTIFAVCNNPTYLVFRDMFISSKSLRQLYKLLMEQECLNLLSQLKAVKFESIITSCVITCNCHNYTSSVYKCAIKNHTVVRIVYNIEQKNAHYLHHLTTINYDSIGTSEITIKDNVTLLCAQAIITLNLHTPPTNLYENAILLQQLTDLTYDILNADINKSLNMKNCDVVFNSVTSHFEFVFKNTLISDILNISFIDKTNITSDDIFFMYDIYGIEIARQLLVNEIQSVLSFDGANIDLRCIKFIVDAMTCTGIVTSISKYTSVLTNALYEREIKKFISYSLNNTKDECNSVESSVFLGTRAKLGTNFFSLYDSNSGLAL
jgi:DNA-directed RNA polymerase beta' subunit